MMFGVNGWELAFLLVLVMVLVGPQRLPEYSAQLARWIRQARDFAVGAQQQIKTELGPDFESVDWKQYDPRQYDPRRIVREALSEADQDLAEQKNEVVTQKSAEPVSLERTSAPPYDAEAT